MNSFSKIGAFFDLDGTLLAPPSLEWRFLAWLITRDEISGANLAGWLRHCAKTILRHRHTAIEGNKLYLAGLRTSLAADWAAADAPLSLPICPKGIAQLTWHHAHGHRVLLITGTLAPLARAIARLLSCPVEICATEIVEFDGRWTGRLAGEHMSRETKARTILRLASQYGLELDQSYAYGNDTHDLPMLRTVGNPVAVNPSWRLARMARLRRWPICKWQKSKSAVLASRSSLLAPKETQ
jgi:alcohol-forming fatty acyl-CoA reductase